MMFDVGRSGFEGETELLLNGTNCLQINKVVLDTLIY